ncbi:MAG: biotin/lipoyl-binding protein, partial [Piscirickettsiaceae bacterium]|nr:biotin/lipoyl-binding protein [Piscirickettsiaceae bacterium]
MSLIEIKLPDIGDFDAVEVIEVLVSIGDQVEENQDIMTLESDKAAMEIPSTHSGTVTGLNVSVGDKVAQGDIILTLEVSEGTASVAEPAVASEPTKAAPAAAVASTAISTNKGDADLHAQTVVLG